MELHDGLFIGGGRIDAQDKAPGKSISLSLKYGAGWPALARVQAPLGSRCRATQVEKPHSRRPCRRRRRPARISAGPGGSFCGGEIGRQDRQDTYPLYPLGLGGTGPGGTDGTYPKEIKPAKKGKLRKPSHCPRLPGFAYRCLLTTACILLSISGCNPSWN
jgi:hypothetical protein